jgi:hypothetical protein
MRIASDMEEAAGGGAGADGGASARAYRGDTPLKCGFTRQNTRLPIGRERVILRLC